MLYSQCYAGACTNHDAHLRGLALGPHSFKETSQRWRTVGDSASDLPGPGIETKTSRVDSDVYPTRQAANYLESCCRDEPFSKRSKNISSQQRDKERLLHKHKREMKGATREIRKDARFLSIQRQKEQEEK